MHYTVYSAHYTGYYTDHSLVYQNQSEGKDTRENLFKILTLIVYNLVLKISLMLSSCLGFANHVGKTTHTKNYT